LGEETKMEINLPDLNLQENKTATKKFAGINEKANPAHHFPAPKRVLIPLKRNFTMPIKTQVPHLPSQVTGQAFGIEIDLGKVSTLALDKEVTVIECPGPEKFMLVKKAGKINLTKIKLSQKEMESIIQAFSEKSRIPLMDGIFKSLVGEMSINAIIADSIVHRFIIYKKSPYSAIEQ